MSASEAVTFTMNRIHLASAGAMCLFASAIALAQRAPARPPIEILKLKWEKQARLPRNFDPSIISTGGAFPDPMSRPAPATPGVGSSSSDFTKTPTQASAASEVFPVTPGRLPVFYVYSMKARNTGVQIVEGVAWDYFFLDPANNKPVGVHQFFSYRKVAPLKSVTFQQALRTPPVRIVDAHPEKSGRRKLGEKAVIECILFSDGKVWRSPAAREGVCDLLKNGKLQAAP